MKIDKIKICTIFLFVICLFFWPISFSMQEQSLAKAERIIELKDILKGKKVSILGDSISTFSGYSNDCVNTNSTICDNLIYYNGNNHELFDVNDTWWKQVIDRTGMELLVNNSWSGDYVTRNGQFRNTQLHDDTGINSETNPDVILVYLGINDYNHVVTVEEFEKGYDTMISNMVEMYPNADIYLMNLLPNRHTRREINELDIYNDIIGDMALKYGCNLVDLYNDSGINEENNILYTGDSSALHPNRDGMMVMADTVINSMEAKYVSGIYKKRMAFL